MRMIKKRRFLYLSGILVLLGCMNVVLAREQAARAATALLPVRLCTSLPTGVPPSRPVTSGINNSVILATEHWKTRFRSVHLQLLPPLLLNDALGRASNFNAPREARNAATCARRHDTFGYIGPLNSPVATSSEPVLNRAGMAQFGPSTTDPTLTSPVPAIRKAYEPATYSHRLAYVTFYRTSTTDALQGAAAAAFLRAALHARTYFLTDDQSPYGTSHSGAMEAYAARIGLRLLGYQHLDVSRPGGVPRAADAIAGSVMARQPDVVYYAGTEQYGTSLLKDLRSKGYTGALAGPDSNYNADYLTEAGPAAANSFCTNPGLDPSAVATPFRLAYQKRFHVPAQPYTAEAYDAANIDLNAIYQAARHNQLQGTLFHMRSAILPFVAHTHWYGATGITTFDRNGDTTNRVISVYAVRHGQWVFVGRAPAVSDVSPAG